MNVFPKNYFFNVTIQISSLFYSRYLQGGKRVALWCRMQMISSQIGESREAIPLAMKMICFPWTISLCLVMDHGGIAREMGSVFQLPTLLECRVLLGFSSQPIVVKPNWSYELGLGLSPNPSGRDLSATSCNRRGPTMAHDPRQSTEHSSYFYLSQQSCGQRNSPNPLFPKEDEWWQLRMLLEFCRETASHNFQGHTLALQPIN